MANQRNKKNSSPPPLTWESVPYGETPSQNPKKEGPSQNRSKTSLKPTSKAKPKRRERPERTQRPKPIAKDVKKPEPQSLPKVTEPAEELPPPPTVEWSELGLSEIILNQVKEMGFQNPTEIQTKAIPLALNGKDLIASSQTGTGKTASFAIPMMELLSKRKGTLGLVLAPTREIATQILKVIETFASPHQLKAALLIGGVDMKKDHEILKDYPQILVATPGRICDHLNQGTIWIEYVEMVILDEADRMLDMGFAKELAQILETIQENRQTLLFSATIPPTVYKIAQKYMHEPESITIGRPLSTTDLVEQKVVFVNEERKLDRLLDIVRSEPGTMIVFTKTIDATSKIWQTLHGMGYHDATYISSNKLQAHREEALEGFRKNQYRIMVATDVAARGIHVDNVAHVVNYDLPTDPEDYVHRIGRTGRVGQKGKATTFVTQRDRGNLQKIEKLIEMELSSDLERPKFDRQSSSRPRSNTDQNQRRTNRYRKKK